MAQTVDSEIQKYLPLLGNSEKKPLLGIIKSGIKNDVLISIEEYNKELEDAESEYQRGEYISNAEMLKKVKQW